MSRNLVNLPLTNQECHIILRALASHNKDESNENDMQACTWIAERILRLISPELGPRPLDTIFNKKQ
jgi:hypothetical protein